MVKGVKPHNARIDGPFPLHRGPFLFAPRFLSQSDWFPEFKLLIERVLEQLSITGKVYQPYDGRVAIVEFKKVEMRIDGGRGTFGVYELGYQSSEIEDFMKYWDGPDGLPTEFFIQFENPEFVTRLGSDYQNVCDFSDRLFVQLERRFNEALREGIGELTAHIGKQLAPLTVIDFRTLRHLQLRRLDRDFDADDNLELDQAISGDEEDLYDLGVRPTDLTVNPTSRAKPSGRGPGRKRTYNFEAILGEMVELLRAKGIPGPKKPHWTGEMFVTALRKRLGDNAPGKSWIRAKLPLAIEKYKSQMASKEFQQSTKP
jgi:hypothetical protein